MAKYSYKISGKRMYLDRSIFDEVKRMNISFQSIEDELNSLRLTGHPKPTYNTASLILIDRQRRQILPQRRNFHSSPLNKKGFILDGLTLSVLSLLSIVVLFFLFIVVNDIHEGTQQSSDPTFRSTADKAFSGVGAAIDWGFLIGLMMAVAFLLYSAYNIGTNKFLFFLMLIINVAIFLVLPGLESFLVTTFYNNNWAEALEAMPGIAFVTNNFTLVMLGIGVLMMVAFLVKPRGESNYG